MTLSRIAAIRPKAVMVSGARGGLGGTSGRRATGISQASAMLTCGLVKKIGVAQPYQVHDPGATKARRWESANK
jgi:hypothetical protein